MSIYIKPPVEPMVWTEELKSLHHDVLEKDLAYARGYRETMFTLSIKKHRAFRQAKRASNAARTKYADYLIDNKIDCNFKKWAEDSRAAFNAQNPFGWSI